MRPVKREVYLMSSDKYFPGSDGLHVGEMAAEMADYEAGMLTVQEAMDIAHDYLRERWLERATKAPDAVRLAYNDLFRGDE